MSRVIGQTPAWLSLPSPGARIFSDPEAQSPPSPSKKFAVPRSDTSNGKDSVASTPTILRRTIAHRGTEVFTVVGNKIRWADLSIVKHEWEEQSHRAKDEASSPVKSYRTFKTPVYYQITNISVSPSGHFLAISTEHTVHVALLPDSSRLRDGDHSELKLRTYQLGPTTHVIPEAPLAKVLWHPLAASSASADCLVTITTEAAVRVWEFNRADHWSFERPALAIDLRKLADGTSSDQDFEPSGFGKSRGFSADAFDMEVASASFGGRGLDNEDPWAAMTLWTAMTNGDVYALCPLLPTKWRPASTTIPALTTSAVSKMASISATEADPDERRAANQRYEWVQELDRETLTSADPAEEYTCLRPSNPSVIPRLQGPFELPVDNADDDTEVCDIIVMASNLDEEDLFSGEDDYDILGGARSLPFTVVCLTTTDHRLHVMIELEGVTGQWLPKKGRSHFSVPTWTAGEFILIESLFLQSGSDDTVGHQALTADHSHSYRFFITTNRAVWSLSLEDWASRVGFEVSEDDSDTTDAGLSSRLKLACQDSICITDELITNYQENSSQPFLAAAVCIDDIGLGTILLTSSDTRAVVAQLEQTSFHTSKILTQDAAFSASTSSPFRASRSLMQVLQYEPQPMVERQPTRAPYAPSQAFYENHMSPLGHLKSRIPAHRRGMLTEKPLRLSPACLDAMTLAHRTFSHQTSHIEKAAAELFRRCERLREDLGDQVRQMAELAARLNRLDSTHEDEEQKDEQTEETRTHSQKVADRVEAAKSRHKDLFSRYERLRRKAGQVSHAKMELSVQERVWIEEVNNLSENIGLDKSPTASPNGDDALTLRVSAAKSLTGQLMAETSRIKEQAIKTDNEAGSRTTAGGKLTTRLGGGGGMFRFQRERIKEVMDMVEREAAIIEAVQGRLGKLTVL